MEKIADQLKQWISSDEKVRLFSFSQPVKSVKQAVEVSGYDVSTSPDLIISDGSKIKKISKG